MLFYIEFLNYPADDALRLPAYNPIYMSTYRLHTRTKQTITIRVTVFTPPSVYDLGNQKYKNGFLDYIPRTLGQHA